jgi:uncharacterized protein (DUF2126 family)
VADALGARREARLPAYEDTWYYLWRERKLPTNVDPFDARLADPLERERCARCSRRAWTRRRATCCRRCATRARRAAALADRPVVPARERCYLIPGDSAMGYRLPLDSQPGHGHRPAVDPCPTRPSRSAAAALPRCASRRRDEAAGSGDRGRRRRPCGRDGSRRREGARRRRHAARPAPFESAASITRTALCAEPRHGRLYLFMPPASELEDYLEIVAAIEDTARSMQLPVILEGYEPPKDPRLTSLRVTPDPGVIEVNIHPAHSWEELVDQTTHLYQAAHETRLSTEKFMLDGRHAGTGGGNHFVLGGATVADSPFLRRPDLLASMVGYWHNHPALSYLFSGLFIGPTSQAPRVDEARNDSVYEIESRLASLALQLFPPLSSYPSYSLLLSIQYLSFPSHSPSFTSTTS